MSRAEGVWGEAQIANYLRRRRYELLAHSYHCRFGEIDLIARKGGVLCFVEVKTRSNLACGLPREYVTAAKQERILRGEALAALTIERPLLFRKRGWTAPSASTWQRSIPTGRTPLPPPT